MRVFRNDAVLLEDSLWNERVRDLILRIHGWDFVCENRHVRVRVGKSLMESDVVVVARTPRRGYLRFIGVELKDGGFYDVLRQGIEKAPLFHVMYVVTTSLYLLSGFDFEAMLKTLRKAREVGVGIILYRRGWPEPILLLEGRLRKEPVGRFSLQRTFSGDYVVRFEGVTEK